MGHIKLKNVQLIRNVNIISIIVVINVLYTLCAHSTTIQYEYIEIKRM